MRKLSLLCVVLLAVGCSNQANQQMKEEYIGKTLIKFPAPKGMEEITPKMGIIYEVSKKIQAADESSYYFTQYLNLDDFTTERETGCSAYTPKIAILPSIKYEDFLVVKNEYKEKTIKLLASQEVKDSIKDINSRANFNVGSKNEYIGFNILSDDVLHEDENSLSQIMIMEDSENAGGKIVKSTSAIASSIMYVKDKILMLKCGGRPEDKSKLSSLVLDWSKSFQAANK